MPPTKGRCVISPGDLIIHPLCVAIILADLELDKETIEAELLRGVVEGDRDMKGIEKEFRLMAPSGGRRNKAPADCFPSDKGNGDNKTGISRKCRQRASVKCSLHGKGHPASL